MRTYLGLLCVFLLTACQSNDNLSLVSHCETATQSQHFEFVLKDKRHVIVAEGENEPRSIGSYSVRLYGANLDFPYDDFIDGVIRIRDGQLEKVEADNNQIIITIKSAGSGGYESTDRFLIKENKLIYSKIK